MGPFDFSDEPAKPKPKPRRPEPEPERPKDAPPDQRLACFALTAAAGVAIMLPHVWILGAPLAAAAAAVAINLTGKYRADPPVTLCGLAAAFALVLVLVRAEKESRPPRDLDDPPPANRRFR
jgi:hypothetical protein